MSPRGGEGPTAFDEFPAGLTETARCRKLPSFLPSPTSGILAPLWFIWATLTVAVGCAAPPQSRVSLFSVPGGPTTLEDFYDLPFPNDIRRDSGGHPDLTGYGPLTPPLDQYAAAISTDVDGFGLNSAIFVRFGGSIDPATLPRTPEASVAEDASVYLVNIDPASAQNGQRIPILLRFESTRGSTIGPHWLAALPYPGFPLEEGTIYGLIVTKRVRVLGAADSVEPSKDFAVIADGAVPPDSHLAAAQRVYSPLWSYLDAAGRDSRSEIANAAVFTTQHATSFVGLLRDKIWALPSPAAVGVTLVTAFPSYLAYDATFSSPNFQVGSPPYGTSGGQIELGTDGLPVVQRTETLRLSFCAPDLDPPGTGWPIVIFSTGAGGDYHSYNDIGAAPVLAAKGIASISIDQVLSGPRNPAGLPGEIAFYNFLNPQAARYNALQGAADNFSLLRLVQTFSYVPSAPGAGRSVRFDPTKIFFFGHSQGGVTGTPFLAFEPSVKSAVLTGTGALLYEVLLNKSRPVDVAALLKAYIPDQPLDEFNPILALIQTWIERSESANYGPLLARHPLTGENGVTFPKDVLQIEGIPDDDVPNVSIEAFATAVGGDQVATAAGTGNLIDGLRLRNRSLLTGPLSSNLAGRTVVLAQHQVDSRDDGHIVAFHDEGAKAEWSEFFATKASTGTATVPAP